MNIIIGIITSILTTALIIGSILLFQALILN